MSQQPPDRRPYAPPTNSSDDDDEGPRGDGCLIAGLFLYAGINFGAVMFAMWGGFGLHSIDVGYLFAFVGPIGLFISLIIAQTATLPPKPFSWGLLCLILISLIAAGCLNCHLIIIGMANC